ARLLLFFRIEARQPRMPPPERFWPLRFARNENGVKPLKTNSPSKWLDFAPPMISMASDPGAKRFVSHGEMRPVDFADFPPRRGSKRNDREIMLASRLARRRCATPRRGNGAASS